MRDEVVRLNKPLQQGKASSAQIVILRFCNFTKSLCVQMLPLSYSRQQKFAGHWSGSRDYWLRLLMVCGRSQDSRFGNVLPFVFAVVSFSLASFQRVRDNRGWRKVPLCEASYSTSTWAKVMGDCAQLLQITLRGTLRFVILCASDGRNERK